MTDKDGLVLLPDAADTKPIRDEPWKVLIADDEPDIHAITKIALDRFVLEGRSIQFLDVYSGRDAVEAMARNPDVALVLMDIVMETEHAGLDAIAAIRKTLGNKMVRIVVRTGHAGQAPEREVVTLYDINDYKEKTELTAKKLFTTVYTGLSLYEDLHATKTKEAALDRILDASSTILRRKLPERLARGALQMLGSVLGVNQASEPPVFGAVMTTGTDVAHPQVLAAIGQLQGPEGQARDASELAQPLARIGAIPELRWWVLEPAFFAARIPLAKGKHLGIYLETSDKITPIDGHVLDVLCRTVATSLQVAQLNRELYKTQFDLILMLSEAIERRSKETGNHVRRVGEYSRLLAKLYGLPDEECDILLVAAALHDAGKIAIPDAILTKPGRLTVEERAVMDTHAEIGADMFAGKEIDVLQAAGIIASQHHERWNGMGYPHKLKGEDIHIYGRIVALTDVFDALGSRRCYKEAWPLDDVVKSIREERGRHFEPRLVDLLLDNLDQFLEIRTRLADPGTPGGEGRPASIGRQSP